MTEPFFIHLTVFKSRLGIANIVLPNCAPAPQTNARLTRKTVDVLKQTDELRLDDQANDAVFRYLTEEKKLVSAPRNSNTGVTKFRKTGRYPNYTLYRDKNANAWSASSRRSGRLEAFPVFQTDIWMSHPGLPSTIGAPTPENVTETVELCQQLGLVSKVRNAWTPAGCAAANLRRTYSSVLAAPDNPFLLGVEAVVYWRQLIERDGVILRELLRALAKKSVSNKSDIVEEFESIVRRALEEAKKLSIPQNVRSKGVQFLRAVKKLHVKRTGATNQARSMRAPRRGGTKTGSQGPGMLEHRVSPRLEWLVDMGCLTKDGQKRNVFEYQFTNDGQALLDDLDRSFAKPNWADTIAISHWQRNGRVRDIRTQVQTYASPTCLQEAYKLVRPPMGPSPIRDVALVAAAISRECMSFKSAYEELVTLAKSTKGVTLTGSRYRRDPQNVHMSDAVLE